MMDGWIGIGSIRIDCIAASVVIGIRTAASTVQPFINNIKHAYV